mgnify:CR=1 FL=1
MITFSTKYDIRNIILSINPEYYKSHWYYEAYVTNKSKMVYLLNQRYTIFFDLIYISSSSASSKKSSSMSSS